MHNGEYALYNDTGELFGYGIRRGKDNIMLTNYKNGIRTNTTIYDSLGNPTHSYEYNDFGRKISHTEYFNPA